MSEFRLRISHRAERDVQEIYDWLANRSTRGAGAWYAVFREVVTSVARNPRSYGEAREAYRLRQPLREALIRTKTGRTYRAIFLIIGEEVVLLRVRSAIRSALGASDLDEF